MSVSTVDESVDLKISVSACGGDRWRVYAQNRWLRERVGYLQKRRYMARRWGPSQEARIVEGWSSIRNFSLLPVVRRLLQCEKSVVAQYEYLDSESIFRVNSGR